MKMLQYFLECYFNNNECFAHLDHIIEDFKRETESQQLKFINELHSIIETKNYILASHILETYGYRKLDNVDEVKKFINFLYDRLINKPTDVKPKDFEKKCK